METGIIDNRFGVGQFGVYYDQNTGDIVQGEIISATRINDTLFLCLKTKFGSIRRTIRID